MGKRAREHLVEREAGKKAKKPEEPKKPKEPEVLCVVCEQPVSQQEQEASFHGACECVQHYKCAGMNAVVPEDRESKLECGGCGATMNMSWKTGMLHQMPNHPNYDD